MGMATFAADHNGSRILCRVDASVLDGSDERGAAMAALAEQRPAMHAVARQLIEASRFEDDGSILIRHDDVGPEGLESTDAEAAKL